VYPKVLPTAWVSSRMPMCSSQMPLSMSLSMPQLLGQRGQCCLDVAAARIERQKDAPKEVPDKAAKKASGRRSVG